MRTLERSFEVKLLRHEVNIGTFLLTTFDWIELETWARRQSVPTT